MKEKCPECGENTIIKIGQSENVLFFSCHNEKCINYAEMLVRLGPDEYVNQFTLIDTLTEIVKHGKTDIQESED